MIKNKYFKIILNSLGILVAIGLIGFWLAPILPLWIFGAIGVLSLVSGMDVINSDYVGKVVEVYPVVKIVNHGSAGSWRDTANYLRLAHGAEISGTGATVFEIKNLTKFKVTRVRYSHSGTNLRLDKMCYLTSLENEKEYFIEDCKNLEALNKTTENLKRAQRFYEQNSTSLLIVQNFDYKTNARKVFEVNRAAVYEVRNFEEYKSLVQQFSYRYEDILFSMAQLKKYSENFAENEFYKYDYLRSINNFEVYEEFKDFRKYVVPADIERWLVINFPDDVNTRWALRQFYLTSENSIISESTACFRNVIDPEKLEILVQRFNRETSGKIKINSNFNINCEFKPPTILNPRFKIVAN